LGEILKLVVQTFALAACSRKCILGYRLDTCSATE